MRAERRNISITNESVSKFLDTRENVSKFLENLVLSYIEDEQTEYVELDQFEELEQEVQRQKQLLFNLSKVVLEGKK